MIRNATHTRRQMIGSAITAIGVGAVALDRLRRSPGPASALDFVGTNGPVDQPAAVGNSPARRWALDTELIFPVDTTGGIEVLNNYGGYSTRNGACGHRGIDIYRSSPNFGSAGQLLLACIDGVLVIQDFDTQAGNAWVLLGNDGNGYRYHHLEAFAEGLEQGSAVRRGQVIGTMGWTGNPGTGNAHLHFEVHRGDLRGPTVNPVDVLPIDNDPNIALGTFTGC
jgi:murein DD-endopeptidase MepM/ murein hydrolase activator NlpD